MHLFEAYGIELEYMIVNRHSLDIMPVADRLLAEAGQSGPIAWSNELVRHVIELKTNGPVKSLVGLPEVFLNDVRRINALHEEICLMPGGMHPWMDPASETVLWPNDGSEIYRAYDRIFDCRSHGWANLQSMHINLPFEGEDEFVRLHAAIRLLLPLLPAIAASSPMMDGHLNGVRDNRLAVYRLNQRLIPVISGQVIPESVGSFADYQATILEAIRAAITPHDPAGILEPEWLNSRGAIARFERDTIEIRLLDIQECPLADISIAWLVVEAIKLLIEGGRFEISTEELVTILDLTIRDGENAWIENRSYLELLGVPAMSAGQIWMHFMEQLPTGPFAEPLAHILSEGTLASRIIGRYKERSTYAELCNCLENNRLF